ncbi:MAG: branched-chain amino acid ABC transporter permease [Actinomycetota bacterium]
MSEIVLVQGLLLTGVYATLALGFALVFSIGRILNLAHTAFYMLAAYGVFYVTDRGGSLFLAAAASILMVVAVGVFVYRVFIEPIREHETAVLLITIAIGLVIQETLLLLLGGSFRSVPGMVSGYTTVIGVRAGNQELLSLGILAVVLAALGAFLYRTRMGLAIRVAAQDREIANLMGIDARAVATIAFGISLFLAALAGIAAAPLFTLQPSMWMHPLVVVLAAVVLGGLGSLKGSLLGAAILAFAEVLVVFYVPGGSFLRTAVALAVMVVILLVRPEGLFGLRQPEER